MQEWTPNEELDMIKMIRTGASIEDISKKHKRAVSDIEKRLRKVIYENILGGKSIKNVALTLNMSEDKVSLYFDMQKEYLKNKREEKDKKKEEENNQNNQTGGKSILEDKIGKLEQENRFIKAILDNKILHHKLNELIAAGKIDKNINKVISDLRDDKM